MGNGSHKSLRAGTRNVMLARRALALVVVVILMGCGKIATGDGDGLQTRDMQQREKEHLRQVHWKIYGPPSEKTVQIISEVGYCVGTNKPRIARVRIEERPRKVLLTAFLTVVPIEHEKGCADVRLGVHRFVHLKDPVGDRALYDASFSPAKLRWPR